MREASYTIQFLDEEGSIYDTKQKISYAEVENAINNQKKLSTLVKQMPDEVEDENIGVNESQNLHQEDDENNEIIQNVEENTETDEEYLNTVHEDDIDLNEIPDDEPDFEEEIPVFSQDEEEVTFLDEFEDMETQENEEGLTSEPYEIPDNMQVASVMDIMDQIGEENEDTLEESESYYENEDWIDEEDEEEEEEEDEYSNEEVEVSEEDVENTIYRKFYSDELELEISMIPFNSKFINSSDIILFETDRPEGWMNEQLNEKSKHYNQEIILGI